MKPMALLQVLFVVACLAVADTRASRAQSPAALDHSETFAVSIAMEREKGTASHPPIVTLNIKNTSSKSIDRDDCSSDPRVWVQGVRGEPPTTYRERAGTSRLLPGEPALACTLNMTWSLAPGETRSLHVLLQYLYDLHEPGEYSVYLEFPAPEGLLRTKTATFQVVPEVEHKQ